MQKEAKTIVLESTSWEQFQKKCNELGSLPVAKKIKGDAFEILTKHYLLTNPIFASKFDEVLHHWELNNHPENIIEELKLPTPEIGVDLIAKYKDGSYCAIQCKFKQDRTKNLSYNELSTFFSVTERSSTYSKLTHRIVCTSSNEISYKVGRVHKEKLAYLTYSDFENLTKEKFKKIHDSMNGHKLILKPFFPRKHQEIAIKKTSNYFENSGFRKGKIIHPCGSGKSMTAYWISEKLQAKTVLIAVPSLALIRQTLDAWTKQALATGLTIDYIAVCSDKDVGQSDDPIMNTYDLGISVTTNPDMVKNFLLDENPSMKVVLTTYQSGSVIISACDKIDQIFDLGIFDEAHKTTGDKSKKFALLIDDKKLEIKNKIFMTATERQFSGNTTNLMSMDNDSIYGLVIDQLSFKNALDQEPPILCDYKVITISVTRNDIEQLISENQLTRANGKQHTFIDDGATIASLIALRKLSANKGIKHAISFHKSIKRANEFTDLNNLLNQNSDTQTILKAFHVSGVMNTSNRNIEINKFVKTEPSVISNARCLTEGVDIPLVDAVLFSDPKQSVIDIVQAAGRAMRTHPEKSLGYIIIPVIIDDHASDKVNEAFKQLVNVVAALGISDNRIIDEAKQLIGTKAASNNDILQFETFSPQAEIQFSLLEKEIKLKIWDRLSFAKSTVGESNFTKWMQNESELSKASMEKYTRVVRKISNDLVRHDLSYSSLDEITEKADLERLKEKYFSIEEYKDLDTRGNRMYSAGFNQLIKYQNFLKKD